jgi:integrase
MDWNEAVCRYNIEKIDKKTLSTDQFYFTHLKPFLSKRKLNQIDMNVLWPYIHHRLTVDGVCNTTVNRELQVVRHTLYMAANDWGVIDTVPKIKLLKESPPRVRFLTQQQFQRLIVELPQHLQAVVLFAVSTGCRMGEILNLDWSRVDLDRRVAWLNHGSTKNNDARGIPLNRDALIALGIVDRSHHIVFTWRGRKMKRVGSAWKKALCRAGITDFRFHDLRHTWASWHVMAGTSLYDLKELGGWRTMDCVMRYAHLAPDHLAKAASRIELDISLF